MQTRTPDALFQMRAARRRVFSQVADFSGRSSHARGEAMAGGKFPGAYSGCLPGLIAHSPMEADQNDVQAGSLTRRFAGSII